MNHTLALLGIATLVACNSSKTDHASKDKAVETTMAKPAEKPADNAAEMPAHKPAEKPAEQAAEMPAAKPVELANVPAVPCTEAFEKLAADLDAASGRGIDYSKPADVERMEATKQALVGKTFAFTGCTFVMQGNDEVDFGSPGSKSEIDCHMRGGEDGLKAFLRTAGSLDPKKMRLDVRGMASIVDDDVELTSCEITAHE